MAEVFVLLRSAVTALFLLAAFAPAQTAINPFLGYWKLNPGRSTFPSPPPDGYFNFRRYEQKPDGWVAHTVISGMSKAGDLLYTVARYDEKEYPVYNSSTLGTYLASGTKPAMTVAFKRMDDHTLQYTDRVNGRITSRGPCTVSADGGTLTIESHAFNAEGKETSVSIFVYEPQAK